MISLARDDSCITFIPFMLCMVAAFVSHLHGTGGFA